MRRLPIDVWSDIACPWCYVGMRRLELALERFAYRDQVDVVWRAFELDPAAPPVMDLATSYAARLAKKYGSSVPEAERRIAEMTAVAARDGLDLHFERVRPGNTFDAHRLLHLAREKGRQGELQARFFRGYLSEGVAIGDPPALRSMAMEVGLARDDVDAVLQCDAHGPSVREDERAAHAIGIRGVPFFVVGGRYGLSGAQPPEVLLEVIERAYREGGVLEPAGEGASCGVDGCD